MEFINETIEFIGEVFKAFVGGFARLFLISLLIWMISLIVLLLKEVFSPHDLVFKEYFIKVWKALKLSFEAVAYGGAIISPIVMFTTKEYLVYSMVWLASILLSLIYLFIRKQTGFFQKRNSH